MKVKDLSPSDALYQILRQEGLDFFVSVPCKLLADLIGILERDSDIRYLPVTREEEGMGILAGAYLAGKRPAIVMQNSGLGNSINAIASLLNYYEIPAALIISHRGTPGEKIEAQKPMGEAAGKLLEAVHVDYCEIGSLDALHLVGAGIRQAWQKQRPVAFLFPFSFWVEKRKE